MKPPNIEKSIFEKIVDVFAVIACLLVALVMVLVCLDVIWNAVTGRTMSWVTEIVEYSLLWLTFLGSAWVLKNNSHIKMDLVVDRISPRSRHMLNAATSYLGAAICFILTYFGAGVTWHSIKTGYKLMTYLEIPSAYINVIIPIGFLMIGMQFIIKGNHSSKAFKSESRRGIPA